MTRSEFSPACASAGANKSSRVRHQSTFPGVRAAIPVAKSAAAAPSIAPLPPPAISCNAPSGSAPPGSRASTLATPKGNEGVARRCWPSICRTWARKDSRADGGHRGRVDLSGRISMFFICSCLVARVKSASPTPRWPEAADRRITRQDCAIFVTLVRRFCKGAEGVQRGCVLAAFAGAASDQWITAVELSNSPLATRRRFSSIASSQPSRCIRLRRPWARNAVLRIWSSVTGRCSPHRTQARPCNSCPPPILAARPLTLKQTVFVTSEPVETTLSRGQHTNPHRLAALLRSTPYGLDPRGLGIRLRRTV